ncbi:MAG: response regulator [Verrucomicrobiaceae bacterium]|nr:response regulator [Verrucomicrobiaceae bacterium]
MSSLVASLTAAIAARVLLIEDDARDVELALARLERANFQVDLTHVATRNELLQALDVREFDVILCDFQLPGFSGIEALEIVKTHALDVPFIFVSGVLGEENAVDMLRRGATDYIVKQRLDRLPIAVRRALNEAEERRARMQAEQALREREAHFSKLVDSLKDYSVVALTPKGVIQSWNAGSQTIFGYTAGDVLGRDAAILFPNSDHRAAFSYELQRAATQGSSSTERWLMRKDGTPFHASIVITAIGNDIGMHIGFSHIVRDTTDSRVAADLLQTAKDQAESANAAKDHFLAVLSHELRTPLNPIAAAAKYLELQDGLSSEARESIEIIKRNIRLETRLIDDLLDISRIVNDKLTMNFTRVNVWALVNTVVDGFAAEALERDIRLRVNGSPLPLAVYGDSERLQQIIWNLVKNALKFTSRDGEVTVTVVARGDKVDIEVSDDGVGIAHDDLIRIFHAFEQGDHLAGTAKGGLGLGLAIAHTLAEKHRGKLTVSSAGLGCGAQFVLTLDQHQQADSTLAELIPTVASSRRNTSLRILLVEDDPDTLIAEQRLLEAMGYAVASANSVRAAGKLIAEQQFDVLLSDIGLPDGSGIDVLNQFHSNGGGYAIALTGYGMESDHERLRAAGFSHHIVKPLAPDYLLGLLQTVADGTEHMGSK